MGDRKNMSEEDRRKYIEVLIALSGKKLSTELSTEIEKASKDATFGK